MRSTLASPSLLPAFYKCVFFSMLLLPAAALCHSLILSHSSHIPIAPSHFEPSCFACVPLWCCCCCRHCHCLSQPPTWTPALQQAAEAAASSDATAAPEAAAADTASPASGSASRGSAVSSQQSGQSSGYMRMGGHSHSRRGGAQSQGSLPETSPTLDALTKTKSLLQNHVARGRCKVGWVQG